MAGKKRKENKGRKTEIDIYRAWCKSCGICAAFCPSGALAMDEAGAPYVKDAGKCIRCGWCELRCPDFAVSISPKEEGNGLGKGI